jgi:hypothetical protein
MEDWAAAVYSAWVQGMDMCSMLILMVQTGQQTTGRMIQHSVVAKFVEEPE